MSYTRGRNREKGTGSLFKQVVDETFQPMEKKPPGFSITRSKLTESQGQRNKGDTELPEHK